MSSVLLHSPTTPAASSRRALRARFRGDIEGLRAVAVLVVVAFHAGIGLFRGGFVGVDVFFVLSGFLITGLLVDELARTGRISLTHFYTRRMRRLLPLATLVLAATAVATQLLVPAVDRGGIALDLVAAALGTANWRYALESTQYMADVDQSPLLHFWSLGVEEQFYVVWPLLLVVLVGTSGVARRSWPVAYRRMLWMLGAIFLGSLVISVLQTRAGSAGAYYGLHTRAWELAAGGLLALLRPVLGQLTRRAAVAAAWVGAGLVLGSTVLMDRDTPFPGSAALVPVLGTVLLLVGGVRGRDRGVSALLSHPVPRFVGRVSYSWYLWHWPCIIIATLRWPEPVTDEAAAGSTHARPAVLAAAVLVSFALAVVSHYAVEQPLRSAAFLAASRRRSARWGGALVATSLVAACGLSVGTKLVDEEPVAAVVPAGGATKGATKGATTGATKGAPTVALSPRTPSEARADKPEDTPACYAGYAATAAPPPAQCRVGPVNGTRTIVLVGDSHAQQWLPALRKVAGANHWTVYHYTKPACTMSDVSIRRNIGKDRYAACERWRASVLDRVAEIQGLDAVVVGRWKDYQQLARQWEGSTVTPESFEQIWAQGSARTYRRLAAAAPRIVVIRDTPRPPHDVPSCLSAASAPAECAFDRAAGTQLDGAMTQAEMAAAPKAVRTLDLTSTLCPAPSCPVVSPAGQIMYRDAHHLTAGYSESLAPQLGKALSELLR